MRVCGRDPSKLAGSEITQNDINHTNPRAVVAISLPIFIAVRPTRARRAYAAHARRRSGELAATNIGFADLDR